MASVKLGILVSAIAGSVGGGTFQRDAQGTQLRTKPLPILRRSVYTGTPRGITAYLDRRWAELTRSQRDGWDTGASTLTWYNRFGDVITGKGYWLWHRVNSLQWLTDLTTSDDYVGGLTFDAYADLACTYEATPKMELTWSAPASVQSDTVLMLFATPRLSLGKSAQFGQTRYIGSLAEGTNSGEDIYPLWNARFGQTTAVPAQVIITAQAFTKARTGVGPAYLVKAVP
jgi:hypothetical protein